MGVELGPDQSDEFIRSRHTHDRIRHRTGQTGGMSRIVVGIDGSPPSRTALRWALEEAARWPAELDVVHTLELPLTAPSMVGPMGLDSMERDAAALLSAEVAAALAEGAPRPTQLSEVLGRTDAASAILDTAKGADLIVVGSRGRGGFKGLLLGSVSHRVLNAAVCPVVVTRDQAAPAGGIIVGVDHFEASSAALEWALGQAKRSVSPLTVVGAWSWIDQKNRRFDPGYSEADVRAGVDELLAGARRAVDAADDVEVTVRIVNDLPARALIDAAADQRLLVVGSRGLGRVRGALLGSVSTQCLHHAPCPVAVVPVR